MFGGMSGKGSVHPPPGGGLTSLRIHLMGSRETGTCLASSAAAVVVQSGASSNTRFCFNHSRHGDYVFQRFANRIAKNKQDRGNKERYESCRRWSYSIYCTCNGSVFLEFKDKTLLKVDGMWRWQGLVWCKVYITILHKEYRRKRIAWKGSSYGNLWETNLWTVLIYFGKNYLKILELLASTFSFLLFIPTF